MINYFFQILSIFRKYKLLFLQFFCLVFSQWLFYYQIGGESFIPEGVFLIFAISILTILLATPLRKNWIFGVFLFLFSFQLYANVLYYRTYYSLIPFASYFIAGNLKGFDGAVIMLMKISDLWFLLPIIIYIIGGRCISAPNYPTKVKRKIVLALSATSVICILISSIQLKGSGIFRIMVYHKVKAARETCFPLYFAQSTFDYFKNKQITLSSEEKQIIVDFKKKNQRLQTVSSTKHKPKNLILIIVESLESWPITQSVNGQPITPFLNSLVQDSLGFYAPYIIPQTKDGGSIDAQLILNTGILPPDQGAFSFLYENNEYPALGKILADQYHFKSTHMFQAVPPSLWNQSHICKAFGVGGFTDESGFRQDEKFRTGLSDSSFLMQSVLKMKMLPTPFYVQLITISSHSPFTIPLKNQRLKLEAKSYNDIFSDYLQAISYVDHALEKFFEQLKTQGIYQESLIIITGDHCSSYETNHISEWLMPYRKDFNIEGSFVPLIIMNGGVSGYYDKPAGQIDIYPTIKHLLSIKDSWEGVGRNIIDLKYLPAVCSASRKFTGDSSLISHCTEAWKISDLILRSNYFKKGNE